MTARRNSNSFIILLWAIAGLLWCYIIYRAVALHIIHDEGYSYYLVKTNYWRAMPGTANTHWLTTFFMRIFLWFPGEDHLWKLRMLSILCWPVFAFCVIEVVKRFNNQWLGMAFYAAALFNPYLISYFSVGRGYASGCTFVMVSIYLAEKAILKNSFIPEAWLPVFFVGGIAVLGNFTSFYFYLGLTGAFLLYLLWSRQISQLFEKKAWRWWFVTGGTILFSIASLLFIRAEGDMIAGARDQWLYSLFGSLFAKGGYINFLSNSYELLAVILFSLFVLAFIVASLRYFRTNKISVAILILWACGGIVLLNIVLHALFGSPYLLNRTALFFYIPLVYGLIKLLDELPIIERVKTIRLVVVSFACLLMGVFTWNLYREYSPRYLKEFTEEVETEEALDTLASLGARKVGLSSWQYGIHRNYYSMAFPKRYRFEYGFVGDDGAVIIPAGESNTEKFDYFLMDEYCKDKWNWRKEWELVRRYEISGLMLLKRKK